MTLFEDKKILSASVVSFLLFLLFIKLFQLQVYERQKYREFSDKNRIRRVRIIPSRGNIYDRNGKLIVKNQPAYSVYAVPFECRNDSVINLLSVILADSGAVIRKKLAAAVNPFTPVKLWNDIQYQAMIRIEENKLNLPGIFFKIEPKRTYLDNLWSAHLLGYLAEVTKKELETLPQADITPGDIIGKKGIEKAFDDKLRGLAGYNFIEVNALGREVADKDFAGERDPAPGHDLYLTIDLDMQKLAEDLLSNRQGGVIFIDTRNGEVLVLCSKPDYDPALLAGNIPYNTWQNLLNDPAKPLFDRMIQGEFPPGSTFKLVMLAAALQENKITENTMYSCPGYFHFGSATFNCWNHAGHGTNNLTDAIKMSCNVYLYNVSLGVDVNTWARFACEFGFGRVTGIDLPGEKAGNVPDSTYLNNTYQKTGWTRGMLLNLGIGQGDLLTTPLQMAQFAMILANSGMWYTPHLVKRFVDTQNRDIPGDSVKVYQTGSISAHTYAIIRNGMRLVVNGDRGTGRASRLPDIEVAGKTGTAQNPHGEDHAWFIGFAPFERPEVAFCVFIENGGGGGAQAAPIAHDLLQMYFNKSRSRAASDSIVYYTH
ncbi:MAG TPA: penicillin-binding protein 2 [bacterium]|nr:penicillin-binding protein 2 [bacterium]HPN44884.1 penicillin-binding protein 2 [bacterium]